MSAFEGRPDLLLIFVAQIAFIIVQVLIYLRVMREEKQSARETGRTTAKNASKTPAKRKLVRRTRR